MTAGVLNVVFKYWSMVFLPIKTVSGLIYIISEVPEFFYHQPVNLQVIWLSSLTNEIRHGKYVKWKKGKLCRNNLDITSPYLPKHRKIYNLF